MNYKIKSQLFIEFPFIYLKNLTFWSQRFAFFHFKYSFCRPLDSGSQSLLSTPATLQVRSLFFSLTSFEFSFFHSCTVAPIQLIPNSKTLLEELRFPQIVKTFPLFIHPKVQSRVQNSPPPVPILSQINPIHAFPSCLFKIYSSIILPLTPRSSSCSLSSHLSEGTYFLYSMCYTYIAPHSP